MYSNGEGVKQDDFKAVEFYQKACDLNHGKGCSNLGLSYVNGKGVKQDDIKAVEVFQKACIKDSAQSDCIIKSNNPEALCY
jgi:TPR repeat protein